MTKPSFVARAWPCCALLLALSALFAIPKDRGYVYPFDGPHDFKNLALAENLSLPPGFLFLKTVRRADGRLRYVPYHRFPWAGFALTKLAMAPFAGNMSAQITAARMLMLLFWCAAAVLAYFALARLTGNRPLALVAVLLAFSSHRMLNLADAVSNEVAMDLFGVALTFHGMAVFARARRLGQLAIKTCVALLFGWHVYALLAPFVLLGLAAGATAAWRCPGAVANARAAPGGAAWRQRAAALGRGLARDSHTRLALVAVLFGVAQLGGNLMLERAAVGGETSLAQLPTVASALFRTGLADSRAEGAAARTDAAFDWLDFFRWQFHRAGVAAVPRFAYDWLDRPGGIGQRLLEDEMIWRERGSPTLAGVGVGALALTACGLLCAGRRRARVLAPLALCGLCWAVPMRHNVDWPMHDYEGVFYFGLPLACATLFPLLARRVARMLGLGRSRAGRAREPASAAGRWGVVAAAGAGGVFVLGHAGLVDARHNPEYATAWKAVSAEFDAIRALIRGRDLLILGVEHGINHPLLGAENMRYHTHGSVVRYLPFLPEAAAWARRMAPDFVLSRERVATPSLRTPGHETLFLYDSADVIDAIAARYEREYRRVAASPALARSAWDIHLDDGALVYLKAPCARDDIAERFYLRAQARGAKPNGDGTVIFESLYVNFRAYGVWTGRACLMAVPLPAYPLARVRAGFFGVDQGSAPWRTAFRLDLDVLRAARAEAFGTEAEPLPPASAGFRARRRGNALVYLRDACDAADVEARFFLHVTAAATLPPARRRRGFGNLDFDFSEHGAVVDGACVAEVPLPDYPVAEVRTGQFAAGAEVWSARLAFGAAAVDRRRSEGD